MSIGYTSKYYSWSLTTTVKLPACNLLALKGAVRSDMSNICPVLAEETCCLIAFLNNFSNGSNIVNDRVFAWTHAINFNSEPR